MSCANSLRRAFAGVGVSAKIGTLGPGVDLTVGLSSQFNARVGLNYFTYTYDDFDLGSDDNENGGEPQDIGKATAKLRLQTVAFLCDWHPWENAFRLTAGAMLDNNKLEMTAEMDKSIDINDHEYRLSHFDGQVSFRNVAPYAGIGVGNAASQNGHWHFAFDLGVLFTGAAEIDLSATASDPAIQQALDADLAAEKAKLEDDAEKFQLWPVLSFGLSYAF